MTTSQQDIKTYTPTGIAKLKNICATRSGKWNLKPSGVIKLIARIEQLEAQLAESRNLVTDLTGRLGRSNKAFDALTIFCAGFEAQLAEAKKLPDRHPTDTRYGDYLRGTAAGWNRCLDAIESMRPA